ncbi:MAG TPA: ATP-binding protein, partial [Polyangiales bacterium]|nr:ATP-binding protein [Polyangiales bacterium]
AYRDQRIEVLPTLGERRVRGDRELLRRCLQSLIENAMRHGPAGSVIRLGSSTAEGRLRLRVSDEGESLPLAQRERVFDSVPPESTSFARKRDAGDIELRFCRVVADAHGGVIAVEDAVPRGVCFCLDLPLRVAFAASERPRVRF